MTGIEKMEAVEQITLTVEALALTASYNTLYHQNEEVDYALGRYTAMLDNGGYLKYDYYRYRDEADAIRRWESSHKRYTWNVEQYTGEGTLYHFEWLEQDLTALQADQAAVVIDIDKDSSYILYHYLIQKGNVYWEINYLSEKPWTEAQLQTMGEQLP